MKDRPSVDTLDAMWRTVIRVMFAEKCAGKFSDQCKWDGHDCHHVVPRDDKRHRWHPLNGVLLCSSCHRWAHDHPRRFKRWLKRVLPEVYKNSKTKGFDSRDRVYVKAQLLAMVGMMNKVLKGGNTELSLLPVIALAALCAAIAMLVASSPTP